MRFASPPKDVPAISVCLDEAGASEGCKGVEAAAIPNTRLLDTPSFDGAGQDVLLDLHAERFPDLGGWQPRESASHLTLGANGIYYFRLAIPQYIRDRDPSLPRELKRSTKTTSKRLALARAKFLCLHSCQQLCRDTLMPALHEPSHGRISFSIVDGSLRAECPMDASPDTVLTLTRAMIQFFQETSGSANRSPTVLPAPIVTMAPSGAAISTQQSPDDTIRSASGDDTFETEQLSAEAPAINPPQSTYVPQAGFALQVAPPTPLEQVASTIPVLYLSDAIREWKTKSGTKFSESTWTHSYSANFRVFREIVGKARRNGLDENGIERTDMLDLPMRDFTRFGIEELSKALQILPAHQGERAGVKEAWERIREGEVARAKKPSKGSVVQALTRIRPFIIYAKKKNWLAQEILDEFDLALTAARGSQEKAASKSNVKPGAVALNPDELKRLFNHAAYRQAAKKFNWKYWIPLLLLYQGLRVSEAAQLFTDDVIYVDGVLCISLINGLAGSDDEEGAGADDPSREKVAFKNEADFRRLKNGASRRIIPVHPVLIELGFEAFVEYMRNSASNPVHLWPQLTWEDKSMYGRKVTRFMHEVLVGAGIWVRRTKVAHSLRATLNRKLDDVLFPPELASRMMGHSTGRMKDKRYNETDDGPGFPVKEAINFLEKARFDITVPTWKEVIASRGGSRG